MSCLLFESILLFERKKKLERKKRNPTSQQKKANGLPRVSGFAVKEPDFPHPTKQSRAQNNKMGENRSFKLKVVGVSFVLLAIMAIIFVILVTVGPLSKNAGSGSVRENFTALAGNEMQANESSP